MLGTAMNLLARPDVLWPGAYSWALLWNEKWPVIHSIIWHSEIRVETIIDGSWAE